MGRFVTSLSVVVVAICAASCDQHTPTVAQPTAYSAPASASRPSRWRFEPLLVAEENGNEELTQLTLRTPQDCMDLVDAGQSLEVRYDDNTFLFCASTPRPLYQSVGIDIHGWARFSGGKTWVRMFSVRTHWAFDVRLVFDEKSRVFTAECCANSLKNGQPVFSFDVSTF